MTEKVLNKVNNDIFSYDTTDNAFKMSRVKPTEIHHASTGTGTSGQLLASTGTAWEWSDATKVYRHPGEPYKIHTLPTAAYQTSAAGTTAASGEHDIFTDTFTKTAGTELYIEWHGYAYVSGSQTDEFALHLEIEDSTNSTLFKNTGHYYNTRWNAGAGGSHRSIGSSQAALSSKEIDPNNTNDTDAATNENYGGTVSIKLVFTKDTTGVTTDNFDDIVYFKTGFFKIFEIWAIGTPYTPSASGITTTSGEVIISDALRINNELNLGNNNPGAAGEVLVSAGPGNLPTWGVGASGSVSMDQIFKVHMFDHNTVVNFPASQGAGYHTVYTNTFTKTAGTHLYAEAHFEAIIGGWGYDQISTGLIIFDGAFVAAPGTPTFQVTGKDYNTRWSAGATGGGHRSLGSSQPALSTKAPTGSNDTTVATNLNFSGDLTISLQWHKNMSYLDDAVDFNHGYIKIFEIWSSGTPYTPTLGITETTSEVIINPPLQIKDRLGIGGANYGNQGDVLTSQGNLAAPTWTAPTTGYGFNDVGNADTSLGTITVGNKQVLLNEASEIARAGIANGRSPIAAMSDIPVIPTIPTQAYHCVTIDQYYNQSGSVHNMTGFSNRITPVNITSNSSQPFIIPSDGAGVYLIGYGVTIELGHARAFYVYMNCMINGSTGNQERMFLLQDNGYQYFNVPVSRTFVEYLSGGQYLEFHTQVQGLGGQCHYIGMAWITKIG